MERHRRMALLGAAIGALVLVGAGCGNDSATDPVNAAQQQTTKTRGQRTVAWDPASLNVAIAHGTTKDVAATFTVTGNAPTTTVRVGPALKPFVTVSPDHFPPRKGSTGTDLVLHIVVPANTAPTSVTGEITLQVGNGRGKGQPEFSPRLGVVLAITETVGETIQRLEADGTLPVLDRSSDLAGPDADNNGIRDDIDAYIEKQAYTSSQRGAVSQLARGLQKSILSVRNSGMPAQQIAEQTNRAINCIFGRFTDPEAADATVKRYRQLTANTDARIRAYIQYSESLDGASFELQAGDTCDE